MPGLLAPCKLHRTASLGAARDAGWTPLHDRTPPRLSNVSLEFDGWLGDNLIETYPLFAVTDRLRAALEAAGMTGVSFEPVPAAKSEQYADMHPEVRRYI